MSKCQPVNVTVKNMPGNVTGRPTANDQPQPVEAMTDGGELTAYATWQSTRFACGVKKYTEDLHPQQLLTTSSQ